MTRNLPESELKLMEIIWSLAPVRSGELAAEARLRLGWKKSTVYTVVKKLTIKGYIESRDAVITPLRSREEVMNSRSDDLLEKGFGGSLPMFLTAFLKRERLTKQEAEELKKLIDSYTEEE